LTSEWITTRIADVCVDNGIITGPFGSLLHAEDYVDIGTPLITVKNIKNNFIDSKKIDFVRKPCTALKVQEIVGAMSNSAGPLTWYQFENDQELSAFQKNPTLFESKEALSKEALEKLMKRN
jgi:hypothetical protein